MYYVPQIWTPLQKPFQNSKYARMRSQTLLNILDLPRDSRMFSKFFFLVPLKECQITNLRGISFFPFVQGHFWIHRIFPSYFTAIKPYYIYRQQCFFLFYLLCLRYSFVHKHTQMGKSFCDLLATELSEQCFPSQVGFIYTFWYSLSSTNSILEQGFQSIHHLQMTSSEEFQQHFSIISKVVCCGFYMKENVAFTLISFAVLK